MHVKLKLEKDCNRGVQYRDLSVLTHPHDCVIKLHVVGDSNNYFAQTRVANVPQSTATILNYNSNDNVLFLFQNFRRTLRTDEIYLNNGLAELDYCFSFQVWYEFLIYMHIKMVRVFRFFCS